VIAADANDINIIAAIGNQLPGFNLNPPHILRHILCKW